MKNFVSLIVWILVLQVIGYGMGMITETNLDPWYMSLTKSSLTPPGYVFGIVWTILYIMLAIVGWQLFHQDKHALHKPLQIAFLAQLLLNWLWTPLFFYFHWIGAALLCLSLIVFCTTGFLALAWHQARQSFWLVLPYWGWVCFATYLNFTIWYATL